MAPSRPVPRAKGQHYSCCDQRRKNFRRGRFAVAASVSTITGAMIIDMIRCTTAEGMLRRGIPILLPSRRFVRNVFAKERSDAPCEAYRKSLVHL